MGCAFGACRWNLAGRIPPWCRASSCRRVGVGGVSIIGVLAQRAEGTSTLAWTTLRLSPNVSRCARIITQSRPSGCLWSRRRHPLPLLILIPRRHPKPLFREIPGSFRRFRGTMLLPSKNCAICQMPRRGTVLPPRLWLPGALYSFT